MRTGPKQIRSKAPDVAHRGGQDDVAQVRQATDLISLIGEHVSLQQRGREYVGLCPFHDDSNPSFAVVVHKSEPFYKCHACGAAGDCFNFVMDYHKMDFVAALKYLAERAGITLTTRNSATAKSNASKRDGLLTANAAALRFFQRVLQSDAGKTARLVIEQRGYDATIAKKFQLGACPDAWDGLVSHIHANKLPPHQFLEAGLIRQRKESSGHYDTFRNRLVFPILDELNRPIAFGARCLHPDDEPKYLNSPESALFDKSSTLFGLPQAKRSIIDSQQAIITEGYTDVMTCHQHGFTNVVATLGTALTAQHARILSRLCDSVVLLFDGDQAGQRAADRAIQIFFASRLDVRICILPDGSDPDDLLRTDDGTERFSVALDQSIDALQYKIDRMRDEVASMTTLTARQVRLEHLLQELARLGFEQVQGVRKAMIIQQLADSLRVTESEISHALRHASATNTRKANPDSSGGINRVNERAEVDSANSSRNRTDSETDPVRPTRPQNVRERAERELLAVLLHNPEALDTVLNSPATNGPATVLDLLRRFPCSDEASQRVVSSMLEMRSTENTVRIGDLLHQLEPADRTLVTDLLVSVENRCDSPESVSKYVIETCTTVMRLIERENFELELASLSSEDAVAESRLSELIELRRRQEFVGNRMPKIRS